MAGADLTRRGVLATMAGAPLAGKRERASRLAGPAGAGHGALSPGRRRRHHGAHPLRQALENLGQQFVVENRGGAGGTIGEAIVAKAAPDGYTLLHDATAFSVNGSLYRNLPFDYGKDFDPVFLVSLVPNILVVTPSVPVNTVTDLIALARASPGGITMASSGNGTLQHLCLEMFKQRTGLKITHVPYRGGGPALTDVMAGQVKFFFANGSSVVGFIKAGKLKAIAHTGKGRLASLPDIPPISETLPGFEAYEWNGVFVPHGVPPAIVTKLNDALNAALVSPQVSARFAALNIEFAAEHAGRIPRLRGKPDGVVEPRGEGSRHQAWVMSRHCEQRSDEAIQCSQDALRSAWIASLRSQ